MVQHHDRTADWRDPEQPDITRAESLLAQMTLEEKAGLLFHSVITMRPVARELMLDGQINHVNLMGNAEPRHIARWHNRLQELAQQTRLGVPVTLSSDPRHSFIENPGTAMSAGKFSRWPEPLGLAATRDPELVREFAEIVRAEYLAVGIRVALHPQADLATEPRWARISGTFGEDADLTAELVTAYLHGLRAGESPGRDSVAAMVKHFPGGGPQLDGEDPHFPYGREQVYPGGFFDYHLRPFEAALATGATQVMPYYGMPVDTEYEEVGFGFNRGIVTGILREQLGFDGIVCTDWRLLTDAQFMGEHVPAKAWGVEHLDPAERMLKALDAGVDQFGGEHCPELLVQLVHAGRVPEKRIDVSARRLLIEKFRLRLFDERRFVDPEHAATLVGSPAFRDAGHRAQTRSLTVLANPGDILPVSGRRRLWVQGIDPERIGDDAELAASPESADLALLRLDAPHEPRPGIFESFFRAGRLDFAPDQLRDVLHLLDTVPTVVVIGLDRPAVIPEIAGRAAALIADFGADDAALCDVLFGRTHPEGKLPFPLPSSMEQVIAGSVDTPREDPAPLFNFGHGLSFPTTPPH